jgi:hypothetical protein
VHARIAALLAALVLALAACAPSGQEQEVDGAALEAIGAATQAAGTARTTMVMTVTLPGAGGFGATMEGVVDMATQGLRATMTMEGEGLPAGQPSEILVVDGVQYQRGELARQVEPGLAEGQWLATPATQPSGAPIGGPGGASPIELIETLRELGGTVTAQGREEVRGVDTRRLRVETTMGDLLAAQEGAAPAESQALLDAQPALREAPVAMDLWADDEDLLRRMRVEMDLGAAMAEAGLGRGEATSVIDVELYDFGVEVDLTAPAPEDVLEVGSLPGSLGGSAGLAPTAEDPGTYAEGPVLPGARGPLAQLPYPQGAERLETSTERVVYAVPAAGEQPVEDLLAFLGARLPGLGWDVTGESREGAAPEEGEESVVTGGGIEAMGHGVLLEVAVTTVDGEVQVVLTAR